MWEHGCLPAGKRLVFDDEEGCFYLVDQVSAREPDEPIVSELDGPILQPPKPTSVIPLLFTSVANARARFEAADREAKTTGTIAAWRKRRECLSALSEASAALNRARARRSARARHEN